MNIKKFAKKSDFWITAIFVFGILIVVNFFSYQIFYRWDLTQNKDYSISKVSKRAVADLEDVVNIKVYFSKNLPSQYISLQQEVGDILDEYANYSNGKIRVEFIDPDSLDNPERDLYMLGIPALQFNVLEKDKYQVVKGYLGMVVQYGDKSEAIAVVQDTQNLEYQVTLAIKKATTKEISTIGLVTSHNSADPDNEISGAMSSLRELYEIQYLNLTEIEEVPGDIDTLLIIGPKENFSDEQLEIIDSFLMRGGSILVLVDGVRVEEGLIPIANDINLDKLLEAYGVKLNHDLVLDVSSGMASFSSGFITFSTNYPLWPKVLKGGFDQNNAVVAKLESLILPWVSSLGLIAEKQDEANIISELVKTTSQAWTQQDNFDLNPQQRFIASGEVGQRTLAISIFGKFNSAFDQGSTDSGRMIVVGDSDFISDGFLRQAPENLVFFQNLVDSLSLDEDLINIRSKGVSDRPIKELSDTQKLVIRYLNVFGLTVIVIIFGLVRYFMRRRSRFLDEL